MTSSERIVISAMITSVRTMLDAIETAVGGIKSDHFVSTEIQNSRIQKSADQYLNDAEEKELERMMAPPENDSMDEFLPAYEDTRPKMPIMPGSTTPMGGFNEAESLLSLHSRRMMNQMSDTQARMLQENHNGE